MNASLRPAALALALAALAHVGCSSAEAGVSSEPQGSVSSALTATSGPIVSAIDSKCLDDSDDGTANDNKIQLYTCNKTAAQSWALTGDTFVGPGGKCLDIQSDHQVAGTLVQLYACNGTNAQKWNVSGKTIKSTGGLCLDVRDGDDGNGTQIQINTCNGNPSQQWTVDGTSSAPDAKAPTTPSLRQFNTAQTTGTSGFETDFPTQFKTPTEKGSTIWVVATIPNDGGQDHVTVTDTQGNTFVALDVEHDTGHGAQTVWHFYATNIKGDSTSTPDSVTVQWANDNYKGVLIAEVADVSAASLVGHSGNIQAGDAAAGDDTVTSGAISASSSDLPALLLSVSMDTYGGTSDEGGDDYAGPIAGGGYTAEGVMWNWDPGQTCTGGVACTLGTFEAHTYTSGSSLDGTFTPRAPKTASVPGTYVTVAAAFH